MKKRVQLSSIESLLLPGKFIVSFLMLLLAVSLPQAKLYAQEQQVLEFTDGDGNPGVSDAGPIYETTIRFLNNTNNPAGNTFDSYWPVTTATFRLINPNTDYTSVQTDGTDLIEALVIGWNFDDDPTIFETEGEPIHYFRLLNELDDSVNNLYTSVAENTAGTGMDVDENRGVFLIAGFNGLRDVPINDRYRLADLEIVFDIPQNNPVLHVVGLGGYWAVQFLVGDDIIEYENSASVEMDLLSIESDTFSGFNRLSGTGAFDITSNNTGAAGNNILNNQPQPNDLNPGVAHGSVEVQGTGITSLTFQVFVRGTDSPDPCGFGWGGDVDEWYFTDEDGNCDEADPVGEIYNFAQDAFMISISSQVDPDEVLLTEGDSYRMLTSPVAGSTYNELIGHLWTQGVAGGGYDTEFGNPNIFTWNPGADETNTWQEIPSLDTGEILPGHGFLMTVFADDAGPTGAPWSNKTLSITGSEPEPPITVNDGGGADDGWLLLGNPFKDPIDISVLLNERISPNLNQVVYVWDRGIGAVDNPGREPGWRFAVIDPGDTPSGPDSEGNPVLGDIDPAVLMPFQGFFIQRSDAGGNAIVTFDDGSFDEITGLTRNGLTAATEGTFYRKEKATPNLIVLELEGESLRNSLWLRFSENGSAQRLRNDALELASYSEHFTNFATKKEDDVLLSIAQLPLPDDDFEIPVTVETTRPGLYTISAKEFNSSLGQDLYLIDTVELQSIRIDEKFSYNFTIHKVAKTNLLHGTASVDGPKKASAEFSDRFLITTQPRDFSSDLPREIALNQNYPNPFNPATQITFELPNNTDIRLDIFDMIGRRVATLVNENIQAGFHTVDFNAADLSSGVYVYRLQTGSTVLTRKLTLIK